MKPRTLKDYKTAITLLYQEINPISAKNFDEVNDSIKKLKNKRLWSNRTTAKHAIIVKNFYAWMTRSGFIESNPFPFHEFRKGRAVEPKYLDELTFKKLTSNPFTPFQDLVILFVLWDTGIRPSELCALDHGDIDLDKGIVHVPAEKSKGAYKDRYIPVTKETLNLLKLQIDFAKRNRPEEKALFLTRWYSRLNPRDVDEMIKRVGANHTPFKNETIIASAKMFRHGFGIRMMKTYGVDS